MEVSFPRQDYPVVTARFSDGEYVRFQAFWSVGGSPDEVIIPKLTVVQILERGNAYDRQGAD